MQYSLGRYSLTGFNSCHRRSPSTNGERSSREHLPSGKWLIHMRGLAAAAAVDFHRRLAEQKDRRRRDDVEQQHH